MIYQLLVPGPVKNVEEVRILEWHAALGQVCSPGDLVVELETHKAVIEVRAGQTGILRVILNAEGEWQRIGAALAVFSETQDEQLPEHANDLETFAVAFEIM